MTGGGAGLLAEMLALGFVIVFACVFGAFAAWLYYENKKGGPGAGGAAT